MNRTAAYAVLLGTIVLAGCESTTDSSVDSADSRVSAPQHSAARSDTEIRTAVQAKYYTDQSVRSRSIDVSAENGVVTLRGTVGDEAARDRAVSLARETEGVTSVNDQLQIEPLPGGSADRRQNRSDEDLERIAEGTKAIGITTNIQARYFLSPDLKPSMIDVTATNDGVVTLEGTVESEQARAEAVRIAREANGVQRVEDRLRVDTARDDNREAPDGRTAERASADDSPDAWITMKIQAKYFVDGDVRGRNIDVTTREGVVSLTGLVANDAERRQAVALARNTDGVRNVVDQLKVDSTMADERPPEIVDVDRPDPWITSKIQSKYFLDPDVKGHEIDVDTDHGVVTLSGTVETPEQRLEAEQIARETEGVARVVNQLKVDAAGAQ